MARYFPHVDWGLEGKPKPKVTIEKVRRILLYFRPYWKLSLIVLLCILLGALLGLVQPLLIKQILDVALPTGDKSLLHLLVLGMVVTPIVAGLVGVGQQYVNTLIGQSVMFDLRNQMYDHLQKMSLRFYSSTKTGDILSRVNNDVGSLENVVTDTLSSMFSNITIFITTLGLMLYLDWRLSIVALLIIPFFVIPTQKVGNLNYSARKEAQSKLGELSSFMQETLNISGAMLVKAFGKREWELQRFKLTNQQLMSLQIRQRMIGRWFFMILGALTAAGPAFIYWYGGLQVISAELTIGTVVAFTAYLTRLYAPVAAIANIHVNIQGSVGLFERLFEYLDMEIDIKEKPEAVKLKDIKGNITFRDVSFGYIPEQPVIKNISFEVNPGQVVALVGPSGSGKTTISSLVPRFYDPDKGQVIIDGYDLRDLSMATLGEHIGIVSQETFLFHATIRENLLYAKEDANEDEIIAAAKAANIHDFIINLPEGYSTMVGERGHKLSGGEKQRLAIARVILKNPTIFILDEATSSLDSHSENLIQEAIQPLMTTRTSLVIAHRLSTILSADKIIVLQNGEIVEQGTHKELLKKDGLYASLYREQFGKVECQ